MEQRDERWDEGEWDVLGSERGSGELERGVGMEGGVDGRGRGGEGGDGHAR